MQPEQQPVGKKKLSGRTKAGLWLLIGPSALFIVTILLFFGVNMAFGLNQSASLEYSSESSISIEDGVGVATNGTPESLFEERSNTSPVSTAANIILFAAGSIAAFTWLPGLIVGIVLLASKPRS